MPTHRPCKLPIELHVIDMQDPDSLKRLIELEKPDFLVPEIEAIATRYW